MSVNLKKHGVNVTQRRASEKINAEKVMDMYANMFTSGEIAKNVGVSPQTILKCLRENNVAIRTRWSY